MKVIYIAGLPRSGSTILQYLLAANPSSVSLGEILGAIRTERDPAHPSAGRPCTCGHVRRDCPFWGSVFPMEEPQSLRADYARVIERFRERFPGRVLIDASKSIDPLLSFYLDADLDVRVVFLVRDFRGWIRSYQKHVKARGIFRPVMDGYLASAYRWLAHNRSFERRLGRAGVPWVCLSYDRLILDPANESARLTRDLDFEVVPKPSDSAVVHELLGSPGIRARAGKPLELDYDRSWKDDRRPLALAPFLLPVFLMNRRILREVGR